MELDLELSISRGIGNLTFSSTETETVFVLLAHLPGFKQDEIEISINESGTKISISGEGERSSIETTISRRLKLATEVIKRFRKVFRIPNGVILDRIDAEFDEENGILIVLMPKLIKEGDVSGVKIEEIKQGEDKEENGEVGKETSLERDKQEGGAPSKEEEQEKGEGEEASFKEEQQEEESSTKEEQEQEKGEEKDEILTKEEEPGAKREADEASVKEEQQEKEASIKEQEEQEEKGKEDDELLTKVKEEEVKGEGEEEREKEASSDRNHKETPKFQLSIESEPDQNGEPEQEKKQKEMAEQTRKEETRKEEIEEERGPQAVPDKPPTPAVLVEPHKPPSSQVSETKEAEQEIELQVPVPPLPPPTSQEPIKKPELDRESERAPDLDRAKDRSEEKEGEILGEEAPHQALEALRPPEEPREDPNLRQAKAPDSTEKDQEIASGIRGRGRESTEEEKGDAQDLGLRKETGLEKQERNGDRSKEKERKKEKEKGGLSIPVAPALATSAFALSLIAFVFHLLKGKKK